MPDVKIGTSSYRLSLVFTLLNVMIFYVGTFESENADERLAIQLEYPEKNALYKHRERTDARTPSPPPPPLCII